LKERKIENMKKVKASKMENHKKTVVEENEKRN
jgi:hypothetical protein